jgi:hypothetical protein
MSMWRWSLAAPALVQESWCDSLAGVKLLALFFFLVAAEGVWIVTSWRVDRA